MAGENRKPRRQPRLTAKENRVNSPETTTTATAAKDAKRPHISVSGLAMHQKCPKQYEYRYIQGLIIPPGIAQIRGKAFHAGIAHNFKQKVTTRQDLPLDEVQGSVAEKVDAEFAGEVFLSPEERTVGVKNLKGRTKDTAVAMASVHHTELAPAIQPTMVERRITLSPDPEKFPVDIIGVLDLADEQDFIRDNKTAAKSPNKDAADVSQQLTTYALLFRMATGRPERGVALDTVVMTEAGNLSTKVQESRRDAEDIARLKGRMELTLASIKTGIFPPANPEMWWCSQKWCGYWDGICPFGKKSGGDR